MKPKENGSLTVITGSMFAGKSEELIRLARRALYAKKEVQVFKPAVDRRYGDEVVVTHMGVSHSAIPVSGTAEFLQRLSPTAAVILVEEVQFFDDQLVPILVKLADEGTEVICAGLDQDFRRMPFGPMAKLLCVADDVVKLRAICMNCGAPASHTYRMVDGKPAHWDDPTVLIGATENYEARCRKCFRIRGKPAKS